MKIEKNQIYNMDCIDWMKFIKDEYVDLIISDPPYRKVIWEKRDYKWKTEEEYIEWSVKWISECYRILRKWWTFYIFWYFRTLSKLVKHCEEMWFELKQQIIIDKWMQAVSGRATKNYKQFPNVTESCLYFVKDSYWYTKKLLKEKQKELWIKSKEINDKLWVKANWGWMRSIYTWNNVCRQVPTKENREKLQNILWIDISYNKIEIVFNAEMWITDVRTDINFYSEKRIHPTQKPMKLISRLINASSHEGMLVFDPFMWSGSTAVTAKNLNRNFLWFELDNEYYEKSLKRLNESLF